MKTKYKKIVAREFLTLVACVSLSILAYLGTSLYNYYFIPKIDVKSKEVKELRKAAEVMEEQYKLKSSNRVWFYTEYLNYFPEARDRFPLDSVWVGLERLQKSDSIRLLWNNEWSRGDIEIMNKVGFMSGEELANFIAENTLSEEDLFSKEQADALWGKYAKESTNLNGLKRRILDADDKQRFGWYFLFISIAIAFPVRYLIMSIIWSIKTLRE